LADVIETLSSPAGARGDSLDDRAPAVAVRGLGKTFRLPHNAHSKVRDRVVHPFRTAWYEPLEALRDVSFEVSPGEFVGIVGRNGSGKSTLLRCLCGIYRPDAGSVEVRGRIAPFIELGVGFNPEMTALDNVVINAVMLGMTAREARARFDEIVAFAELEEFVDLKLMNYSSGMLVRLAFAVTVQVDADVLLFDEVLAVGDAAFQEKCFTRFEAMKDAGKTILLVTHDMDLVERFCDRAVLFDRGELTRVGDPTSVAGAYAQDNARAAPARPRPASSQEAPARERRRLRQRLLDGTPVRRTVELVRTLAVAEYKLRYLDAALSYLWAVMRPLALFGVLYFVFTKVGRFDDGVTHYGIYLLTSLVLWTFFAESTGTAVHSLVRRAHLLRKVPFPHVAIPLSVTLTSLFDLGMTLIALFAFVFASGVAPRVSWLELPLLIALLAVLVAGASMLLSMLYVRYRDIDQVWQLARQALFYATPILYVGNSLSSLPDALEKVLKANPLAAIFTQARHALIGPEAPSAAASLGGTVWLAVPLGVIAATFVLGVVVYRRQGPRATESV
jgi:ABC-type polysaccharide/polyol phosphate transport system ATPase subunit/ABC-type polysaccharide/polyol phosphate export permease